MKNIQLNKNRRRPITVIINRLRPEQIHALRAYLSLTLNKEFKAWNNSIEKL